MISKIKLTLLCSLFGLSVFAQKPINSSKINKNYFTYKGKTIALVTSGEHYGSVLNTAFDYKTYLDVIKKNNLNYTRIFTGSYVEKPGAFNIADNTLAPDSAHFLAPWARSNKPGFFLGGNKFDLSKWDPAYFARLKDFVNEAAKRDIIVEVSLFSSMYGDNGWLGSPLNRNNNVNHKDSLKRENVNTLSSTKVNAYQAAMVAKIVKELNKFDNVFYEIQNEPWSDNPEAVGKSIEQFDNYPFSDWQKKLEVPKKSSMDWHKFIANTIAVTETILPKKHMIAHNYSNFYGDLSKADISKHVNLVNFHYAVPTCARDNQKQRYVLGFDESGFTGSGDSAYVRQAWRWLMSGGGLFNNLDYSFTTKLPIGTNIPDAPGGGGVTYRNKLGFLKNELEKLDLDSAKPYDGYQPKDRFYMLMDKNSQGLAFFEANSYVQKSIEFKPGKYIATWYNPHSPEEKLRSYEILAIDGEPVIFFKPEFGKDFVLTISKK